MRPNVLGVKKNRYTSSSCCSSACSYHVHLFLSHVTLTRPVVRIFEWGDRNLIQNWAPSLWGPPYLQAGVKMVRNCIHAGGRMRARAKRGRAEILGFYPQKTCIWTAFTVMLWYFCTRKVCIFNPPKKENICYSNFTP